MADKILAFAKKAGVSAPLITGVIARAAKDRHEIENAWVSMVTASGSQVLVTTFSPKDWGSEVWPQALKLGHDLAERLGVPFRKKRDQDGSPVKPKAKSKPVLNEPQPARRS